MKALLRWYFHQRWGYGAMLALFAALFALVFWLYDLPLKAVGYPAAVCSVLLVLFALADFGRMVRRHHRMERTDCELGELPEPQTLAEADDRRLLLELRQRLRESQRQAQAQYDATVAYYTTWAHQIKTPLSAMRLQLQSQDSSLSRSLGAELNRTEQYVEMALVYLRLDSPTTDYILREYDLDSLLRPAVRQFAGEFIARKLTLHYEPVNTRVLTDEKWLGFVVSQVLSNALKYTPSGSIAITMESPSALVIQDTGIGIAPEDMPRIFERGYTGANGRLDQHSSGIGLYLCRRICQNLGHTITARSVPGEGTAISIDFSRCCLPLE